MRSLLISIILHVLLIAIIIISSLVPLVQPSTLGGNKETIIDAIIVDSSSIFKKYNQIQKQENDAKQSVKNNKNKEKMQYADIREQAPQQTPLKKLTKNPIQIARREKDQDSQIADTAKNTQEAQKIEKTATKKTTIENKHLIKKEALVKKTAVSEIKQKTHVLKTETELNLEAITNNDNKITENKKIQTRIAKNNTKTFKNSSFIDDLLNNLTESNLKTGVEVTSGQSEKKQSGGLNADIDSYANQVKSTIQSNFYGSEIFRGKICELELKIASDGFLISIIPNNNPENDYALCNAAIRTAKLSKLPKPPTDVYQEFKKQGSTVIFTPKYNK